MSRLWDKGQPVDDLVLRYTVGDDHVLDGRLVAYDVRASSAHAEMLRDAGYLSTEDCTALTTTLQTLADEHADGQWTIALEEEDCHTALENRLTERLGDIGGRIHLGRSRNDQVLAALRLYLADAVVWMMDGARGVITALDGLASDQGEIPLPGYTHLQRAMPSSVALWAGGFRSEIQDDVAGLAFTMNRIARNPLGSAAGYGVPVLDLDREGTRAALDFQTVHEPVTAVQLSRGKAESHVVFELTLLMQDVGRLAADLCLFASQEFAFVQLPNAFTTGSSIMPQKRNPDVFELVRARAAQIPADLQAILAVTQKMTSGYHRDLQLIKPPLFRALDTTEATLAVMGRALPNVRFNADRTSAAMDSGMYATERAYRLVRDEGIPFREAYRRVASNDG
ncbi:MAG: argininosuccinate lyase [Planctomycetes bacterium]|nr:argininosuccinate lyase [Planctomycetota bacterium]